MESLFAAAEATALAEALRVSRWGYAAVNAGHVLGIALLVGAIVPLDLRLLGLWRGVDARPLVRVLVPMAAAGLGLAVATGVLLFSIRARQYADLDVFRLKLVLVASGGVAAIALHAAHGWMLETASSSRLRYHAALSLACWLGALVCGRMIAFVAD